MATSGSNYYSPDGGILRLVLSWNRIQTDIANNRSKIRLTLQLRHGGTGVWFSARKSGNLHGQSFTYSGGFSNTGTVTLRTRELWVNHDADGTKSITFNAKFDIAITYRGSWLGSMSTSVTANIDRIPRSSSIDRFSIANHLKPGTSNSINLGISRASSGFTHDIELRDGSTVLSSWKGQETPTSLSLTSTEVNTLLNRMSNVTSRTLTLRVITKSGSSTIGTTSRNATATVHADVKPSVSAVSLSQTGNPVSTHTLQGFSKITASFTRSAGYGATISSSSIQVRRRSGGADSQTINSNSGTTSNPVSLNGVYEARGTARDSRGRITHTAWATITVTAYRAPTITNFSAVRSSSTPTTVDISRGTTHTVLGTSNHLTYTIQRRQGTGAWTNVNSGGTGTVTTSGATGSATSTGNSVTQSYEFRLIITDKLGGRAESLQSVSTQRVVLDIHKNEGVGIGKIHEYGVLDVDGPASFGWTDFDTEGKVPTIMQLKMGDDRTGLIRGIDPNGITVWQVGNRMLTSRALYLESFDNSGIMMNAPRVRINNEDIVESGSNANGDWVRFYDGTMICHNLVRATRSGDWNITATWTFPATFISPPTVQGTFSNYDNVAGLGELEGAQMYLNRNSSHTEIRVKPPQGSKFTSTGATEAWVNAMAIGRWK